MADHDQAMKMRKLGHALFVPSTVAHSHVMSSLRLAKVLHEMGVTITFVAEQNSIGYIQSKPSIVYLENFHLVPFENPAKIEKFPVGRSYETKVVFQPYAEKLIADKKAGILGPTCIIADRYLFWMKDIADELELPLYLMFSNCVIFVRLMQGLQELHSTGDIKIVDGKLKNFETVVKVSGLEFMQPVDVPWITYNDPKEYLKIGQNLLGAAGVVVNSFLDLEEHAINTYMKSRSENPKVPELFTVGPVFCLGSDMENQESLTGTTNDAEKSGLAGLKWLDTQPVSSVLYICIGSWVPTYKRQAQELAQALEASNQRFLWVLPRRRGNYTDIKEMLPPGFIERVGDRGAIVTGWIDQVKALHHPSLCGFVSHCGWLSCLETITAGMPVLTWPQSAEQHLNARYLVDVLHMAVIISEKRGDASQQHIAPEILGRPLEEEDSLITREEFMEAIDRLNRDHTLRVNAQQLKKKAEAAVAVGGSSYQAVERLAERLPKAQALC
ncbi:hypothetical protein Mapa_002329 [Marchantia paleacea]|nr:hypothetical protein Mapa_002329 [Marchantia paleacea]